MDTKILIIEDDVELVEALCLMFTHSWPEAHVVYSYTGKGGIELAAKEEPDAIVLDLGLPDISGFEVLSQIRLFSSVPVIVLTARSSEDSIVQAMDADATDYMLKPFRHSELLARIRAHTNRWWTGEIRRIMQG